MVLALLATTGSCYRLMRSATPGDLRLEWPATAGLMNSHPDGLVYVVMLVVFKGQLPHGRPPGSCGPWWCHGRLIQYLCALRRLRGERRPWPRGG